MNELYTLMETRFIKDIRNESNNVFFFFEKDEEERNEKCYYLNINHYDSFCDISLMGMNDGEILELELHKGLLKSSDEYLKCVLKMLVENIHINLLESEYETTKHVLHNLNQLKTIKG